MRYTTKKILPYATLPIILSLQIHSSLATETLTITEDVKQGFYKSISQVESGPGKPLNHEPPTLPETTPSWTWQQSLKAVTEVPWLFATSLLEPFINDAPKVLGALKNEGKKLKEQGALSYTLVLGKHMRDTIKDNPLDVVIMTGAMALGWTNVAEYSTLVPLTVGVAGGVKNGKAIYELAHSIDGHTVIEKSLQFGLYGLAIYAAASLPVSYALSTPTLGTQFQINQNTLSTGTPIVTTGLTNGAVVAVWPNSANNIVARIFYGNGTFVTGEFDVSSVATSSQVTPSVASLTSGDWIATWQGGTTNILARVFSPTGTAITSPFTTNQITTYTAMGSPVVTGLANGNAFLSWYANSAGNYEIPGRIFSPSGTAIIPEFNINQITTNSQTVPSVAGLTDGTALVTWYSSLTGSYNILGRIFYPNGTALGNEFTINQATTPLGSPGVAGLTGGNALVEYGSGNDNFFARIIQNGAPTGNEFQVPNTTNIQLGGPSVSGLTTGNALVVWSDGNMEGRLFDPTGTALTSSFVISTNNPVNDVQGPGSVVGLTNGDGFVSWYGTETGIYNIYGRPISFSTSPTPTSTTGAPTGTTSSPTGTTTGTPTPTSSGIPTSSTTGIPTTGIIPTPTSSGMPTSSTTGVPTPHPSTPPVTSAGSTLSPGILFAPVKMIAGIVNSLTTLLNGDR